MGKATFIEFIGDVWVNGKAVAAYRLAGGSVQLRAETTGSKIIAPVKDVTAEEYETLRSEFYGDCQRQDGNIGQRALAFMGVDVG